MWYDKLSEKKLWENFEKISSVPRDSGKEDGIRAFLLDWAESHGIKAITDKTGNVIMKKKATPGYEERKSIALQGHMDMVCVKREGSEHDFTKDPIEIVLDGNTIKAKDTTLGADNGIAVAIILTLFEDDGWEHGPLEGIFTVNEEVGLTGAFGLEGKYVDSRLLINIDNEEEGFFCIGCAGGLDTVETKKVKMEGVTDGEAVSLEISSLSGGHSGSDINKGRCNAIHAFARYLSLLDSFRLVSVSGGTKRNVIPSFLRAELIVPSAGDAGEKARLLEEMLRVEFVKGDGNVTIAVRHIDRPDKAVGEKESREIADALLCAPNGVQAYSQTIEGIVETSCNLAIIAFDRETVTVTYSIRSSIDSAKKNTARIITKIYEKSGFTSVLSDGYPGWIPNPESPLAKKLGSAYRTITGKEPLITAIHAGLECGIINDRVPGMDSISIGPNLYDVHSVNEHLEADSAERVLSFLKAVIKDLT